MSTKLCSNLFNKYQMLKHQHKSKFNVNVQPGHKFGQRCVNYYSQSPNWKRQIDQNNERRKVIPKLVYLHNPWKYLITKFNLLRLKLLWDREFKESEFIRGSKQAAAVLTNEIRNQNTVQVGRYTTPIGFQQITRDMILSRNDTRLQLVRFQAEHLRRAIPMKVATRRNYGRKFCFIDMLFVGLRNTKDFDSPEEVLEITNMLRRIDSEFKTPQDVVTAPHRILFAEIFIRFRRDYTGTSMNPYDTGADNEWSISFYKILTFDVLNYDPRN